MKNLVIAFALIIFAISLPAHAKSPSRYDTIEQLAQGVAEAYEARDLGRLDAKRPYVGKVKIVVEHSLRENAFVVKWVKSLAQAERWLKSRAREDGPTRQVKPLLRCKLGVCSYNFDGGILHNQLYLKRITYGFRKGKPYIKTILLLDGD